MSQVLIFGDSIAYGAWDKEGGWVERLKVFTNRKAISSGLEFYCAVYNLAIDGDYTRTLLKRLESETKQRADVGQETIFVFAIGKNDAISNKKSVFWTPLEKFRKNLKRMAMIAKKYSPRVIFIGFTPVDERKTNPVSWDNNVFYKNESQQKYNKAIKSVCKENKIGFIEIFKEFIKTDYKNLLEDGLHPNSKGHEKIFEIVKDYLIENKII